MSSINTPIENIKEQLTKLFDGAEDADLELLFEELDGLKDHVDDLMMEVDTRLDEIQTEESEEEEED